MFKVTETLLNSVGDSFDVNYVRDGSVAQVMTSVGQILQHRNGDTQFNITESITIKFDDGVETETSIMNVSAHLYNDLQVMERTIQFLKDAAGYYYGGKFLFNTMRIHLR